jgi:hypothetical protein
MEPVAELLGFIDPLEIGKSLAASGWSLTDEISALVDLARDAPNPRVRLQAITHLRRIVTESLVLSGHVRRVTMEDNDGTRRASITTSQTARALEAAHAGLLTATKDDENANEPTKNVRVFDTPEHFQKTPTDEPPADDDPSDPSGDYDREFDDLFQPAQAEDQHRVGDGPPTGGPPLDNPAPCRGRDSGCVRLPASPSPEPVAADGESAAGGHPQEDQG